MNIRALIIIAFAGLVACTATPNQLKNIPLADPMAIPTNEAECSAAGQHWVEQGLPGGSKSCAVRTSDARKICTNSNQCQGECLVEGSLPVGRPAIGSCSEWLGNFGCHKRLEGGVVGEICTD
jgi:hypothetical protein